MAWTYYGITAHPPLAESFTVRADSYEDAARAAVHRLYPSVPGLIVERVSGDSDKGGYFQAYLPCRSRSVKKHGQNFYVQEL